MKKPRLFYYEEAVDAWVEWHNQGFEEGLDRMEPNEEQTIRIKRVDLTDEELANIPED
jgi:hypothetical protein